MPIKSNQMEILNLKKKFYEQIVIGKKQKNEQLNNLIYEKNKQIIELNRKIEYLIQEQKYELIEILQSFKHGEINEELLSQLMEKYNTYAKNEE